MWWKYLWRILICFIFIFILRKRRRKKTQRLISQHKVLYLLTVLISMIFSFFILNDKHLSKIENEIHYKCSSACGQWHGKEEEENKGKIINYVCDENVRQDNNFLLRYFLPFGGFSSLLLLCCFFSFFISRSRVEKSYLKLRID